MPERIDEVEVGGAVRQKIGSKHGLSEDDVFDVLENYERAAIDIDDEGRERLLVRGCTGAGRRVRVVLFPIDRERGTWRLGTAFPD